MSTLNQVTEYLFDKISRVNLNNQKANRGGVLIKTHREWEEKLQRLVSFAFQNIQTQFSHNSSSYLPGETGLTMLSMSIGQYVAHVTQREPLKNKRDQLALGDLMIEGFVYHGFCELVPPTRRDESYLLKAAPKWEELAEIPDSVYKDVILGSFPTPPEYPTQDIHKAFKHLFDPDAAYVKAVHKLQQVGWTINHRVLDVVLSTPVSSEPITDNPEKEQKRRSKLIEWNFITKKAEVLKEYDAFYQTYEVDYRGRIYNTEPFLNYQSNDIAKGLLMFAEPKEITEDGRYWLAIHTACAYNMGYDKDDIPEWCEEDYASYLEEEGLDNISVDKMTLNDRAQWTVQHMDKILNCELDMKAEKPFMFLAACYEWDALQYSDLTCLPVAIDGSNNGWQHLGAISKDQRTGELVGLVPTDIQKDFYVQTAKELIVLAQKDERLTSILEQMPMKHIRKGISKRGSMTRAYSAGAGKIADNMYFDCKTEDFHEKYGITKADCRKFAKLLVKAIENVCPGPLQTMSYLQQLAAFQLGKHEVDGPGDKKEYRSLMERRYELKCIKDPSDEELNELDDIVKLLQEYRYELVWGMGESHLEWTTPSGFTARYEKFTMEDIKERVTLNRKVIKHVLKAPTDRPDIQGFMCGISPNYIHSMDAAHMALVIDQWDGAFGAVHDSFSTHASDVDDLLEKTKQVFIELYDYDNYFDVIRNELTNNKDDVQQPDLGELDIGGIYDSSYFFA